MTVFALKLIAVLTMLTDHLGIILRRHELVSYDLYIFLRCVGRFAFPIYTFLLAEGFRHLRRDAGRLRAHALMLLVLTVVSEICFDWFDFQSFSEIRSQSVMFTLSLGFLGLCLAEPYRDRPWIRVGIFLSAAAVAWMLHTDYSCAGVLLVFACAWYLERFGDRSYEQRLAGVLAVIVGYFLFLSWFHAGMGGPAALWKSLEGMRWYAIPHLLLVPLLAAYNGRLGPRNKILHRCYQGFYPVHLAILGTVSWLLG